MFRCLSSLVQDLGYHIYYNMFKTGLVMMPNLNIFDHFEFLINFSTIWLTLYYLIYTLFNFEIFSDNLSSDKIDFKQIRQSYSVSLAYDVTLLYLSNKLNQQVHNPILRISVYILLNCICLGLSCLGLSCLGLSFLGLSFLGFSCHGFSCHLFSCCGFSCHRFN